MKKTLIILIFFLSIILNANAQKNNSYRSDTKTGICLTGAGLVFSAAGFLTTPDYTYTQSNMGNNTFVMQKKQKPFIQQGPRFGCIVTGVTLTVTGLITMIAGK